MELCVSDTELFQVRDELLLNKGEASAPISLELEFRTDILRKENTVYVTRFDQTHDAVPNIGVCNSRSEGWLTTEGVELDVLKTISWEKVDIKVATLNLNPNRAGK